MRNSAIRALPGVTVLPQLAPRHRQGYRDICAGAGVCHRNPIKKGPLSMTHRIARSLRGSLVASASITALVLGGMVALAQQPPAPAAPKPAAPKAAAPKPAAPAAAQKPAATPPAPAAQAAAPAQDDMPTLVYSPWTKFCSTPG